MDSFDTPYASWRSDKAGIGLTGEYEKLFVGLDRPITYLEVGTAHGESMKWAKEYFKEGSKIIGVDIYYPHFKPEGTEFFEINQNDSEKLIQLGKDKGPFDIIIDDASHVRKETENTFHCLYPYLAEGGFYIIEDWGAGYMPLNPHCKGMESLVTELVWKYGGKVVNMKGNYAIIDGTPHKGFGGYMVTGK